MFLVIVSCQENKTVIPESIASHKAAVASNKTTINTSDSEASETRLTKEQFIDFFPNQIDDYKLIDVSVSLASAMYVIDNNYNASMTYSL